jgi:hypothetical protein
MLLDKAIQISIIQKFDDDKRKELYPASFPIENNLVKSIQISTKPQLYPMEVLINTGTEIFGSRTVRRFVHKQRSRR